MEGAEGKATVVSKEYKEAIHQAMLDLSADKTVRFIGYNVRHGGKAMGTLEGVPEAQLIEMPVAENLIVSAAIGMALAGLRPVVYIERFDFVLNAIDAIVNHLDRIKSISSGEFAPTVIIRTVVGNSLKPLYTGSTHTSNYAAQIARMVSFPVQELMSEADVGNWYSVAKLRLESNLGPMMLVEFKDLM